MAGFFNIKNTKASNAPRGKRAPRQAKSPCEQCGLFRHCKSPKMKWTGEGKQEILFVAEGAGKTEDEKWQKLGYKEPTQLIGQAGQLLRKKLNKYDFDLDEDAWKDNAVMCRPSKEDGSNRAPSDAEVKLCRPHVFNTIEELRPKKIILLGKKSIDSFLGHRMNKIGPIGKWVGWQIPDQTVGAWVFPNWHPSYLLRNEKNKALYNLFEKYLKQAIEWDEPFPEYGDERKKVRIVLDQEQAETVLRGFINATERKFTTFDYETSGLKPHREGHKIYCIGISNDDNGAFAFPLFDDPKFLRLLKRYLTNEKIKKTGQNIKFEDTWSRFILGYRVRGWYHDTMLMSHVRDNRTAITSLGFQTYVQFGTLFKDETDPYLKPKNKEDEKDANAFNRVPELLAQPGGWEKLLTRCGLDAMFEHRLANLQLDKGNDMLCSGQSLAGYKLLHDGIIECSDVESKGIAVDLEHCEKQSKHLTRRIKRLNDKIQNSEEVEKWKKETKQKTFNPNSDPELRRLLYGVMGYKKGKGTEAGNASTDKAALMKIGTSFALTTIDFRRLSKLKGTYLAGFMRETIDGLMHPFINLHIARTFRSSVDRVNFQNIPVRDKEAQRITRAAIIPRKGRQLLDVDYSGVEVRMACCNTKDPKLIEDVLHGDMHRDEACNIFMLPKEEITGGPEGLRYIAKNGFVFPEFYGDWFVSCAKDIWPRIEYLKTVSGVSVRSHLAKGGIKNYRDFEKHVEEVEDAFWNKKYVKYAEWKEIVWEDYQRKGYVDLLTGFRCGGLMKKNDVTNYPNQGPAFHCLLKALILLNRRFNEEKLESFIIGQIHDDLVFDAEPDELEYIKPIIRETMCEEVPKGWDWLIVPLDIDAKISEIDGNWSEVKNEPI